MHRRAAFTLIEILVVIGIIALLIGILLPALSGARQTAQRTTAAANMRSIHQAMVIYAGTNNDWYPGMSRSGKFVAQSAAGVVEDLAAANVTPALRFWLLLKDASIIPDLVIAPGETEKSAYTGEFGNTDYTTQDFDDHLFISYAMPSLNDVTERTNGRWGNWRDNSKSQVPALSDRNTDSSVADPGGTEAEARSIWGDDAVFNVIWNDNHASVERAEEAGTTNGPVEVSARYSDEAYDTSDNLFEDTTGTGGNGEALNTAYMIFPQ